MSAQEIITQHLDIWTAAHKTRSSAGRGSSNKLDLYGIKKLRELILELAVRGKLVPQDPNDEPASELLKKIAAEKAKLINEGKIKKEKPLQEITDEETPFELPIGWCWSKLINISIINPRNAADDELDASFVPMTLIDSRFDGGHEQELRQWKEIKQGFTHFAEGDIGVAKITPCFENSKACVFKNLVNNIGAGTTELHIVRPINNTLNPRYVLACLKSPSFLLVGEKKMTGTAGQKRLPKEFLESYPFPLPPLAEQHRIVAKVDELMAFCDQLEQTQSDNIAAHAQLVEALLASLTNSRDHNELRNNWQRIAAHFDTLFTTEHSIDQLKQTILQLAVMGKLVPQDPNDEPASELLKKIAAEKAQLIKEGKVKKEKPLPEITDEEKPFELPSGWEWSRFGPLVNFKAELVRPELFLKSEQVAPDLIEKGTGRLLGRRTVEESGIKGPNSRFHSGQILYSKIRPSLSKAVIVDFDGLCSADMYPLESLTDSEYLLKVILSEPFLEQVRIAENRIKMPKLNIESLSSFLIPIAPLAEQHRIVAKVDELMSLCDTLKINLQNAQTTQLALADALVEQAVN